MSEAIDEGLAGVAGAVEPGGRLLRSWPLTGGLSAEMTAVEVARSDGRVRRLVVRRARPGADHGPIIGREFGLLLALARLGLPTPAPLLLDDSGTVLAGPFAVLDYVEGSTCFVSDDPTGVAAALADQLAAIHRIDPARADLPELPDRAEFVGRLLAAPRPRLDDTIREGLIRDTLGRCWPPPAPARTVLLHGDFWPGNVLWDEGRIVAVVDWEDAAIGDPVADVAITRLDLLWAFGPEAMATFTDRYAAVTGVDLGSLPVWDLVAALRPAGWLSLWGTGWAEYGRNDVTPATMRAAHRWFVDQAVAALS